MGQAIGDMLPAAVGVAILLLIAVKLIGDAIAGFSS